MKDKSFVILISLLVVVALVFVLGIIYQDKIFKTAISNVVLSDQIDSNNRVVGSKTVFEKDAGAIYAEVKVSYGKSDTKVRAEWYLVDELGVDQNIAPGVKDQVVTGTRPVLFKIVKPAASPEWKSGSYKVKIIFNSNQVEEKLFSISSSSSVSPTVTVTK